MYTLEVFIAFFITFAFIIFVVSTREYATTPENAQLFVLKNYEQRPDFRDCVYENNITCVEDMMNASMPRAYDFHMTVNDPTYERDENLYVDTLYITGDTAGQQYVVRLYYWKKH
ncbi:MAG: hypothetical protein KJ574_05410 [Nanoarchaeota archaeon]|nr:hypothetical protein [Nanoarchaeota archaeon]